VVKFSNVLEGIEIGMGSSFVNNPTIFYTKWGIIEHFGEFWQKNGNPASD
jgi:hypothetical protein